MEGVVEFEKELLKRAGQRFAQWRKIDLHNHSPASFDYSGNTDTALEDTARQIIERELAVVMFTDHACLPDKDFVTALRKKTGSLIIRGTELNVAVDAWGKEKGQVGKNLYFHLLIGFRPDAAETEDFWLQKIYHECGSQDIDCGGRSLKAIEKSLDHLIDCLRASEAIIIPAHLHSRRDAYKSRSVDDIYEDASFLRFAREHFTALEVSHVSTAKFFSGARAETGYLHKTCIIASDAHKAEDLGANATFAQLQELTFDELKAALELPFRVSIAPPAIPDSHIVGAQIDGLFLKDTWIRFSPYCNVLIGVKGSGKTSVLECVRFALGAEVPESRRDEVRKHLDAILGPAGKVRILVKRSDGARVVIERSLANPQFIATFPDGSKHSFRNREGLQFPAHILGWHEIEHVAVDPQIRQLYLNKIAGEAELRRFDEELKSITSTIRQKHDLAVSRFDQLGGLESRIERLEELRKGLQTLTDGNLIALKEKYEKAVSDISSMSSLSSRLTALHPQLLDKAQDLVSSVSSTSFLGSEQLIEAIAVATDTVHKLVAAATSVGQSLQATAREAAQRVFELKAMADEAFAKLAEEYRESFARLSPEQQHLLESHIKVAEETRQLNTLNAQAGELRIQLAIIFAELRDLCKAVVAKMDERTNLRKSKVVALSSEIAPSGVRLTVTPYAARWRFEHIAQSSSRTWEVYQNIVRQHPPSGRFHELLVRAYEDLREHSSKSAYSDVLQSADLGPMLDAYEEDDLAIEFDPRMEAMGSGNTPQYKPIDQLSAGQRCTAIFPILLKLESAPLLIDQPEDNLDNRHIANKISVSVLDNKRARQMLFTSHNANLVVMSDPETIVAFESTGGVGTIERQGFLGHPKSSITPLVLDILDGGERALELRARKYGRFG